MAVARQNWKRLTGQMLAGAVTGAAVTAGVLYLLDGRGLDPLDAGQMLAIIAGIVYGLVGIIVGIGALYPDKAWKLLNVQDAQELRDERRRLGPSAIALVLIGTFFLSLASARGSGTDGLIGNQAAIVIALASLLGIVALSLWANDRNDEFTRLISIEASAMTLQVALVLLGGWAALAHLGFVDWIGPLALIAAFAMLQLVIIFAICGKRGLLVPR